jgi:hypothetical protein
MHFVLWRRRIQPFMLRKVFKEMGKLIHDIGCMVGKHADNYVKTVCPDYEPQIEKTIQNSL